MANASAVSAPIRQLVDVFAERMADVDFPGVSAKILAEQARALEVTAEALAAAEQAMVAAREAHAEAQSALRRSAALALGYAKVYASDDEGLLQQLDAIDLDGRGRRKLPPKRKPRKRKPSNVAELPLDDSRAAS